MMPLLVTEIDHNSDHWMLKSLRRYSSQLRQENMCAEKEVLLRVMCKHAAIISGGLARAAHRRSRRSNESSQMKMNGVEDRTPATARLCRAARRYDQ